MRLLPALAILIGIAPAAFASDGFNVVIPERPGIPVVINGVDASYGVVEGEFGLGKGVNNQPTVYGGHYVDVVPNVGHYYPSLGQRPGYGRLEIEPPADRKLPPPAQSFHQSWSARSTLLPPTQQPEVPFYPPPVIVAPPFAGERGSHDADHHNLQQPRSNRPPH
jgi:hypothetical protein